MLTQHLDRTRVSRHIEGSQRVLYARRTIKIQYATLDGIMLIGSCLHASIAPHAQLTV